MARSMALRSKMRYGGSKLVAPKVKLVSKTSTKGALGKALAGRIK